MQQGFFSIQQTCPRCHGTGKMVASPCKDCSGNGRIKQHKTLSVKIPAGVDNDDRIRLSGEGEHGVNGGPPGDLYVVIHTKPHAVALLPMLAGVPNDEARQRALELLTALDVQHRARAMPAQLSGGEQQRVAIARGLVNRPPVILADEPTAPLDTQRAMAVIRILNDMAQRFETSIVVVTHDEKIIPTFKRIYHIRDGVTHEEAGEARDFE